MESIARLTLMKKNLVILGSTGSIGENALRVAEHLAPEIRVVGLAAKTRLKRAAEQAAELQCGWVAAADTECVTELQDMLPPGCRALGGTEALCEAVSASNVDIVLCAIVGTAGLEPVLAAVRAGKDIALASKEILVMAGELVMPEAGRCGVRILPVDSEHSALFQCLDGRDPADVSRLILTASGGPFRTMSGEELRRVTPERASAHPTWSMGGKITVDSATLMNKGLEIIEAHWLFGMPQDRIDVVIHPQSIVHSMVEFTDGSVLGQMGVPDMRLPIQYALTYPERRPRMIGPMDFSSTLHLDFEPPDETRFPALRLAREAVDAGGTMPAVLNAANEAAVAEFCAGRLSFPGIWETVAEVMSRHEPCRRPALGDMLAADAWARETARAVSRRRGE